MSDMYSDRWRIVDIVLAHDQDQPGTFRSALGWKHAREMDVSACPLNGPSMSLDLVCCSKVDPDVWIDRVPSS